MNCKPNQLVMVVRDANCVTTRQFLGHTFIVTRNYTDGGALFWEYEGPRKFITHPLFSVQMQVRGFADEILMPIEPGDGADETLGWVPVPERDATLTPRKQVEHAR